MEVDNYNLFKSKLEKFLLFSDILISSENSLKEMYLKSLETKK